MQLNPENNKLLTFILKNNLLAKNDRCLVAVSGGTDSVALLDLLFKLRKLLKIQLAVAHVNYNLREQASIDEEEYVKSLAELYQIPFYCCSLELKKILQTKKGSLEDIARNIRYQFFEKISKENNFHKIALAHNANDQAETVLMKLIRGAAGGLKGMETKRTFSIKNQNLQIIRPLLCFGRAETEEYCKQNNLEPKTDLSNFEDIYTRNRIRNKILPLLISENPNFLEAVQQTSNVLSQEDKYLTDIAKKIYHNSLVFSDQSKVILSHSSLKSCEEFLLRRVFKAAFEKLSNDLKSLSYKHLEAIREILENGISQKIIELPENYFFTKDRDYLIFHKGILDFSVINFNYRIESEEDTLISETGLKFRIEKHLPGNKINRDKFIIFSEPEKNSEYTLRNYSPEIKFLPFGRKNEVRIKEFLDKKKIPEFERKNIVLFYVNNILIWIVGIARSNHLLVNPEEDFYSLSVV